MNTPNNVRQIFLEDVISREKEGYSPIQARQRWARRYAFSRWLYNLSLVGVATTLFLAYTKSHTYRKVYLMSFLATLGTSLIFYKTTQNLEEKCRQEFQCTKDEFPNLCHFYRYSITDFENYYEKQGKH